MKQSMFPETFSKLLKKLLDKQGLLQSDLSNLTGIEESIINNWLTGKYLPTNTERMLIASALNISIDRLYIEDEEDVTEDVSIPWAGKAIGTGILNLTPEGALHLHLNKDNKETSGNYLKHKYEELKDKATSIVDRMANEGVMLSKDDVNTFLELLRLEIMYRYRM